MGFPLSYSVKSSQNFIADQVMFHSKTRDSVKEIHRLYLFYFLYSNLYPSRIRVYRNKILIMDCTLASFHSSTRELLTPPRCTFSSRTRFGV